MCGMKLYRYRPINEYTFSEITEKRAWFSNYAELNDPFEGVYVNKSNEYAIDQVIKRFHACCFSEINDSLLLWAHYAENHKGICLEYDFPDDALTQFISIRYSDSQPVLERVVRFYEGDNNAGALSIRIGPDAAVFLTKSLDWKYEHEWRMLHVAENSLGKGGASSSRETVGHILGTSHRRSS